MTFLFVEGFKNWLSNMADGIMGTLITAIRTLCFWLIEIIYRLMVNLYNLFDNLCNARLLDNEILGEMSRRIGFLLGIIMFFYVIFSFIQMLVNPDKITDKEKGAVSIVKKIIIVILMLALYNSFFDALYGLQKKVIDSNVISSIILPYTIAEGDKDKFGNLLSNSLIKAFYYVEEFEDEGYKITEPQQSDNRDACNSLTNAFYNQIYNSNTYDIGYMCLNESIEVEKIEKDGSATTKETYIINFDGIIAVAAGGFTVYLLAMYCFKIGIRMIQLAFLEIISPMAIISYLTPKKDNMLTKWWKIYSSTYIDVFIRIAIINFVVFLICSILSTNNPYGGFTFWESLGPNLSLSEKSFYSVVIILALLTFAKKAPDLIKELIPTSASKLGFGMAMKDIVGLEKVGKWAPKAATGVLGGALGGAAIGLLGGGFGGFAGGLFKGGLSGLKGQGFTKAATSAWKSRSKTNAEMAKLRANGGNWFGYNLARMQRGLGIETQYEQLEREYSDANDYVNNFSSAKKKADSEVDKFASNYKYRDATGNMFTLKELDKMRNDDTRYDEHQRAEFDDIYNKIHGFARDQAMLNNGAVKSGEMVWEDRYGGNWADIEKYVNTTGVTATANNVEIEAYMNNVLSSSIAKNTTGNRFEKAKNANDIYEKQVRNKINDEKYKRAKANNGK